MTGERPASAHGIRVDDSAAVRLRGELMAAITGEIRARGWSQAHAAQIVGITAPRMSDLMRGKLEKFSADALVSIAEPLGIAVTVQPTGAWQDPDEPHEFAYVSP